MPRQLTVSLSHTHTLSLSLSLSQVLSISLCVCHCHFISHGFILHIVHYYRNTTSGAVTAATPEPPDRVSHLLLFPHQVTSQPATRPSQSSLHGARLPSPLALVPQQPQVDHHYPLVFAFLISFLVTCQQQQQQQHRRKRQPNQVWWVWCGVLFVLVGWSLTLKKSRCQRHTTSSPSALPSSSRLALRRQFLYIFILFLFCFVSSCPPPAGRVIYHPLPPPLLQCSLPAACTPTHPGHHPSPRRPSLLLTCIMTGRPHHKDCVTSGRAVSNFLPGPTGHSTHALSTLQASDQGSTGPISPC